MGITKGESGKMGKECFVMFIWAVVLINELGKEGLTVNMKLAKLQREVEAHAKLMANSIPGQDTTGVRVGHNVSMRVNSEVCPVGAMLIVAWNSWVRRAG